MKKNGITEYFEEVETERKYNGYFCWIPEVITIAILGSMCGLRNVSQIHQWAASERVSGFLKEKFAIEHVPYARMEWSVETMHWLLDVHFEEDWCRIENKKVQ